MCNFYWYTYINVHALFHMHICYNYYVLVITFYTPQGRMQDFKLGGAHLKKLRRAEGGAKIFGVFRVKNHDFTPKNHIFSNLRGGRAPPPGSAPAPENINT